MPKANSNSALDLTQVSLVIPAFNEALGIPLLLDKLSEQMHGAEVIVVDDGSSDNTAEIVSAYEGIRVIRHPVNQGYGAALRTGMQAASREFVVWADSDGQHRMEDILTVAQALIEQDLDYCVGVRGQDSFQESSRKLGKWVLRQVVRMAVGQPVADFNSGLRGFRGSIIRKYLHLLPKGFGASTTTSLIMLERNYRGAEVPIKVQERVGKSSVRQFRDGLRTITLILRIFLLFKPLNFFGGIGLALILLGLVYGLLKAYVEGLGFPVLGAIVFLTGLQTLFMGLIMDQISAMRRERFE